MQKITSIHLNGKAYQLEEAGYDALRAYLSGADAQLNDNPDKIEIIADLELAIAEKCNVFLNPGKDVITTAEVNQVIEQMGPVDAPGAAEDTKNASAHTKTAQSPKRLYLIHEGAWFAGVCAGLAAYFNMDVTVMRVISIVLTLVTGGAMLLVYLALMLFVPYATTSEERAEAYGLPFNAQEVINRAKESYAQFTDKQEWRGEWNKRRAEWNRQMHEWKHAHRHHVRSTHLGMQMPPMHPMRLSPILGIVTGLLAIVWISALISLISSGTIFGWMIPAQMPLWGVLLLLFVVYHAITGPMKATRYVRPYGNEGWGHDHRFALAETLEVIFFFICAWFLYDHYPQVQVFVHDLPGHVRDWIAQLRRS